MSQRANSGYSRLIRSLRRRGRVAAVWSARPCVYHAEIHKRAMESALLFGRRRKVGFPAMVKQAGAGGKYRIKRQTCLLQGHGPKKGNIQVRTRSGSKAIGQDVQRLHRIICAERAPCILGEFELPIDPLRQYGLSKLRLSPQACRSTRHIERREGLMRQRHVPARTVRVLPAFGCGGRD